MQDHLKHWWTKTVGIDHATDVAIEQPVNIDTTLEMVMELPSKYKTAIYLYYYEVIRLRNSGDIDKSQSTIRGYLLKGRKLLKMEMEGDLA